MNEVGRESIASEELRTKNKKPTPKRVPNKQPYGVRRQSEATALWLSGGGVWTGPGSHRTPQNTQHGVRSPVVDIPAIVGMKAKKKANLGFRISRVGS